ncbi:MAG: leucine-rich repeat domain-containing protein [Clostridia bacterium]|nr:leucine-rich repeat domain-containing protein [Clostridia bacterium]
MDGGTTYERMFDVCHSLTEIVRWSAIDEITEYAFYGLTGLECVTVGECVGSMGKYAFYGCTSMEELYFNAVAMDDLKSRNYVFYDAGRYHGGMTLTVGAKVKKIPAYLFYPDSSYFNSSHSPNIVSIVFGENSICASIGESAFYLCSSLTSVMIPVSITSVGYGAFWYCRSLSNVYYFGGYEDWGKIGILAKNTELSNATRYYYCEMSPTPDGNFWHFEEGAIRVW